MTVSTSVMAIQNRSRSAAYKMAADNATTLAARAISTTQTALNAEKTARLKQLRLEQGLNCK
jgi:hypothetical protein